MSKPLRGVILDLDGTLIASNDAHAQAWVDALDEHGYTVAYKDVRALIGMGGDNLLPELIGIEKDTDEGKAISERRKTIINERYLADVRATPGVRSLLRRMHSDGLELVLATSAQADELDRLLAIAEVGDMISQKTSASDAESSKPDPDIVQAALERLGCAADEVLMLGDTPYDITAAGKAGIRVVALRTGGFDDTSLAGALAIYDDPADLLAHYDDSPFGRI